MAQWFDGEISELSVGDGVLVEPSRPVSEVISTTSGIASDQIPQPNVLQAAISGLLGHKEPTSFVTQKQQYQPQHQHINPQTIIQPQQHVPQQSSEIQQAVDAVVKMSAIKKFSTIPGVTIKTQVGDTSAVVYVVFNRKQKGEYPAIQSADLDPATWVLAEQHVVAITDVSYNLQERRIKINLRTNKSPWCSDDVCARHWEIASYCRADPLVRTVDIPVRGMEIIQSENDPTVCNQLGVLIKHAVHEIVCAATLRGEVVVAEVRKPTARLHAIAPPPPPPPPQQQQSAHQTVNTRLPHVATTTTTTTATTTTAPTYFVAITGIVIAGPTLLNVNYWAPGILPEKVKANLGVRIRISEGEVRFGVDTKLLNLLQHDILDPVAVDDDDDDAHLGMPPPNKRPTYSLE